VSILERVLDRVGQRGIVVEPMRPRHVSQIMAIERDAYPRPWSAKVFHDELREARRGLRYYVVARRGRTVLGYGGIMFVPASGDGRRGGGEAHVTNIAVSADERRAGVATRLLCTLVDAAIRRGCTAWTLEVRATSHGAQALYRRFGFAPAGVRKRYYENNIDAIVMWCHDIQGDEYAQRLEQLSGEHVERS
jgi:ribosomal-protein-alanine N-acetyltransferase